VIRYFPEGDDQADARAGSRKAARRRLLDICPGTWSADGQLSYYSHLGSNSNTLESASDELFSVLEASYLNTKPPIPAINRWNKVYSPLAWWTFGMVFFNLMPAAFDAARSEDSRSRRHLQFVANVDLIGPISEEMYRKVNMARWNKGASWLLKPSTLMSMTISVVLFELTLPLMAALFKGSQDNNKCGSVLSFMSPISSPVLQTMRRLQDALHDLNDQCWTLLRPWSPSAIHNTACAAWTLAGELFMRCELVSEYMMLLCVCQILSEHGLATC
jgi:hypothetical protein